MPTESWCCATGSLRSRDRLTSCWPAAVSSATSTTSRRGAAKLPADYRRDLAEKVFQYLTIETAKYINAYNWSHWRNRFGQEHGRQDTCGVRRAAYRRGQSRTHH